MNTTTDLTPVETRVLDYFNFIYFKAFKRCGNLHLAQDYAQLTAERLLKVADPDLGVEYITKTLNSVIVSDWRKPVKAWEVSSEIFPDVIADNVASDYETKEAIASVQKVATAEEWTYMVAVSEGYNIPEIAEAHGVSRQRVDRKLASLRKKATKLQGGN